MQKKVIYGFLAVIAVVIIVTVVADILGSRPEKRGENPYALNVGEYREVDPALITYNETKNFKLQPAEYRGISISGGEIYIIADNYLQVIDTLGRQIRKFDLPASPRAVIMDDDLFYIGFAGSVSVYTKEGSLVNAFNPVKDSALITSLAIVGDRLFVADAGNRQVLRYTKAGELLGSFKGKREGDDLHGFIIPSPYFDLVNNDDELWVVNPGMLALENYSPTGELRAFLEKKSMDIEGFTGCCNPAHLAVLPGGQFVSSEKKIVRIKVYEQSGKLAGVVAEPKKFKEDGQAPDIAVSDQGIIYALDFDRKLVRVFEHK